VAFDKNDPSPLVQPEKRTTKVNFSIVAAVVVFVLIGIGGIIWARHIHF
jgi:hypothetical protein